MQPFFDRWCNQFGSSSPGVRREAASQCQRQPKNQWEPKFNYNLKMSSCIMTRHKIENKKCLWKTPFAAEPWYFSSLSQSFCRTASISQLGGQEFASLWGKVGSTCKIAEPRSLAEKPNFLQRPYHGKDVYTLRKEISSHSKQSKSPSTEPRERYLSAVTGSWRRSITKIGICNFVPSH